MNEKKILLIEDEEVIANLLKRKLEEVGYAVELARDGEEGLNCVHARRPDLILLDMQLPKVNGMTVLKQLNEEGIVPDLPLIVVSNSGQPVELDLVKKLGARDYLVKLNFEPEEIISKIHVVLRGAPAPASAESEGASSAAPAEAPAVRVRGGASVLLVEDDAFLSEMLTNAFRKKGWDVSPAMSVEQARTILGQKHVDVICLDLVLPGVDGFTYLEEIKKTPELKDIPVLILSNLGQKEDMEKGLALGAAGYFVKATKSPTEISEKVESLLPH